LEILLNGNSLDVEGINAEVTVLQLVRTVEESLKGSGASIVELLLDGTSYSPDETNKIGELKVVDFAKVELVAVSAVEMIQAAFEDGDAGITHLEGVAQQASSELRIGKIKSAMDHYIEFVDGVEWLVTMLNNADKAFAANMAESSVESERQGLLGRIGEQMAAVKSAQESEDWVGVADILEYEFPEIFSDARKLIETILGSSS